MSIQRLCAMSLVLLVCVMSAVALNSLVYPLVLGTAGIIGTGRYWMWNARRMHLLIVVLLLALFAAVSFRVRLFSQRFPDLNAVALTSWQTLIRLLLVTMVLTLFIGRSRRCPAALALFVPAVAACVGQITLIYELDVIHRVLEVTSVAVMVVYGWLLHTASYRPGSSRSRLAAVLTTVLLILTLNAGWALGSVLYDQQEYLNVLASLLGRARTVETFTEAGRVGGGFLDSGRIHALQDMLLEPSPDVLFRVDCDEAPGYLRMGVFERYVPWRWHSVLRARRRRPQQPEGEYPDLPGPGSWFRLEPATGNDWQTYRIVPQEWLPPKLFTALGADWIRIPSRRLVVSFSGTCSSDEPLRQDEPYSFAVPLERPEQVLPDTYRQSCLQVPPVLDPRITALAVELFLGAQTTRQKIAAVRLYFLGNYTYSLNVEVSEQRDFLPQFLFEADRGFCEYFATAGAILLRLGGVPTRYVTGMYVVERDAGAGDWTARLMDAHAWVEAWDETTGRWEIVDPTVPAALDAGAAQAEDALGRGSALRRGRLWAMLYRFGLAGPVLWLLELLGPPWVGPTLLGLVIMTTILVVRRRRRVRRARRTGVDDVALQRLEALRRRVDRRLARQGLRRADWQTLHAFAAHLERTLDEMTATRIATWYRRYARLRYAPVPQEEIASEALSLESELLQWPK